MYEYNRISYEAHERARRREHEAEGERYANLARADSRRHRLSKLAEALKYLRLYHQRDRLARES